MSKTWHNLHPNFRLNGKSYDFKSLTELAKELLHSNKTHEIVIGEFFSEWLNDSDAVFVNTSGSTGQPKTILLQKEHCINSAKATGDYFNLQPNQSALLCLSAEYIAGKMMLVRAMVLGLRIDYVEPDSVPLHESIRTYDFAAMVPLQVSNSLQNLDQIRTLIIGGAPVSNSLKDKLMHLNTEVFETYGMTETITHIAVRRISDESFKVFSDVSISQDERNCLVIDAPKISADKVITNDLVELLGEKEFVWLGRYDNIINSGGIKLIPEQIEEKLAQVISSRFFVTGITDKILGEKLVLVVEGDLDTAELFNKIQKFEGLDKYEVPKQVFSVSKFAATSTGKVKRLDTLKKLRF